MKTIGIMSMQRICNYGSYLQAKALKSIFEDLNCRVQFIDYHIEPPLEQGVYSSRLSKLKGIFSTKTKFSHKIKYLLYKRHFYTKYLQNLGLTQQKNYTTSKLDLLVIGSDEVFNCIQSNYNVGYSLDLFGKSSNAKKTITYAASFGNTTLDKLEKYNKAKEIGELLLTFSSLSVRDQNSFDIVHHLIDRAPEINVDPVLAYGYNDEIKKAPYIRFKKDYILIYAYSGRINLNEARAIKTFAQENNLLIISIGGDQPFADQFIDCQPENIFAYFKSAKFIITDTFHGTIFSVLTHSSFLTITRSSGEYSYGNFEKLSYLLQQLELTTCCSDLTRKISFPLINYQKVDEILRYERQKTYRYLKQALDL